MFIVPIFAYVLFLDESNKVYLAIIIISSTKLLDYMRISLNFYTYLENSMVSFDRINNYAQLESEKGLGDSAKEIAEIKNKKMFLEKINIKEKYPELKNWIENGRIVFKNVSAKYSK